MKWAIQTWNATRRPGKAEDGPPYGKPGMWSTFARHATLEEATAGLKRVFGGGDRTRNADDYRIVLLHPSDKEEQRALEVHPAASVL